MCWGFDDLLIQVPSTSAGFYCPSRCSRTDLHVSVTGLCNFSMIGDFLWKQPSALQAPRLDVPACCLTWQVWKEMSKILWGLFFYKVTWDDGDYLPLFVARIKKIWGSKGWLVCYKHTETIICTHLVCKECAWVHQYSCSVKGDFFWKINVSTLKNKDTRGKKSVACFCDNKNEMVFKC